MYSFTGQQNGRDILKVKNYEAISQIGLAKVFWVINQPTLWALRFTHPLCTLCMSDIIILISGRITSICKIKKAMSKPKTWRTNMCCGYKNLVAFENWVLTGDAQNPALWLGGMHRSHIFSIQILRLSSTCVILHNLNSLSLKFSIY